MNILKSISYIFPVYNEEKRLPKLFRYLDNFLKKNKKQEIIFVLDGCSDNSEKLITEFSKKQKIKIIKYHKNMGKGFAVKQGILKSTNEWILVLDIDLSVKISELISWIKKKYIYKKNVAYFASRNLEESRVNATFTRRLCGKILRTFLKFYAQINISDTQCGFKLFHKKYIKRIINKLLIYRYAFDIDICCLLQKNKIEIKELPVKWNHREGSKVNIIIDGIKILLDVIKIKNLHKK